jgi:hypothetical protein
MNMVDHALAYNAQGICVIPCKPRDKMPAMQAWEEYQFRQSTPQEITDWWKAQPLFNIGLVHGVNGFVSLDIDHDRGAMEDLRKKFPDLTSSRLEQSGSGEGYHVPLFIEAYPDLGYDNTKDRPKGNKTWKTPTGDVNIRARWCQTVVPPSVHPSGGLYRVIQSGGISRVNNLAHLVDYLNDLDPAQKNVTVKDSAPKHPDHAGGLEDLKNYWPDLVQAFYSMGVNGNLQKEPGGGIRILGHGGLVVDANKERWYSFADEMGGDVIDAFGWVQYGSAWDRHNRRMFSEVVQRMKADIGYGRSRITRPELPERLGFRPSGYWR